MRRRVGTSLGNGLGVLQGYLTSSALVRAIQRFRTISLTFLKEMNLHLHVVWRGWMTLHLYLAAPYQPWRGLPSRIVRRGSHELPFQVICRPVLMSRAVVASIDRMWEVRCLEAARGRVVMRA